MAYTNIYVNPPTPSNMVLLIKTNILDQHNVNGTPLSYKLSYSASDKQLNAQK